MFDIINTGRGNMAKFCEKCGKEISENANFCESCGVEIHSNLNHPKFVKRDIALAILLTILTCGLYGIYWFVTMTDDINTLQSDNSINGTMAFLYTLFTCGIYAIYWNYMMGKKMYEIGQKYGKRIDDNSIIYLILSIVGLHIVSFCLIQNDLNKFAD